MNVYGPNGVALLSEARVLVVASLGSVSAPAAAVDGAAAAAPVSSPQKCAPASPDEEDSEARLRGPLLSLVRSLGSCGVGGVSFVGPCDDEDLRRLRECAAAARGPDAVQYEKLDGTEIVHPTPDFLKTYDVVIYIRPTYRVSRKIMHPSD